MTYTFTIESRLPGLNDYIAADRGNKYGGAKLKKTSQREVEYYIQAARLRRVRTPIWISYKFYEPNRRRDKDNIAGFAHKIVQDALVAQRVIDDDGWSEISGWTDDFAVDKKRPRVEVTLIEQGEG